MARIIDADSFLVTLQKTDCDVCPTQEVWGYSYPLLADLIEDAPTIERRPTRSQFKRMAVQLGYEAVIRCQNCVHWQKFNDDLRRDGMCEALLNFHGAERNMTNEDFFCSYGERRTDFVDDNKIGERKADEQ